MAFSLFWSSSYYSFVLVLSLLLWFYVSGSLLFCFDPQLIANLFWSFSCYYFFGLQRVSGLLVLFFNTSFSIFFKNTFLIFCFKFRMSFSHQSAELVFSLYAVQYIEKREQFENHFIMLLKVWISLPHTEVGVGAIEKRSNWTQLMKQNVGNTKIWLHEIGKSGWFCN